jgi:hypothetical protein
MIFCVYRFSLLESSALIGQECWGEVYNITKIKIYRNSDAFADLEPLEFEVPMVCLVTERVSGRRDRC